MTSSPREAELRSPSSSTDCSDDSPSRGIQVSEALVLSCDLDTNSRITKLFKRQQSTMHLQTSRYALEEEAMVPLAENLLPYAPPVQSSETLLQLIYRLSGSDHKLLVKLLQNLTKTLLDTYCHYGSLIVLDHCEVEWNNAARSYQVNPPTTPINAFNEYEGVVKEKNINFLVGVLEWLLPSLQCTQLSKMDLEDAIYACKSGSNGYHGMLICLENSLKLCQLI